MWKLFNRVCHCLAFTFEDCVPHVCALNAVKTCQRSKYFHLLNFTEVARVSITGRLFVIDIFVKDLDEVLKVYTNNPIGLDVAEIFEDDSGKSALHGFPSVIRFSRLSSH